VSALPGPVDVLERRTEPSTPSSRDIIDGGGIGCPVIVRRLSVAGRCESTGPNKRARTKFTQPCRSFPSYAKRPTFRNVNWDQYRKGPRNHEELFRVQLHLRRSSGFENGACREVSSRGRCNCQETLSSEGPFMVLCCDKTFWTRLMGDRRYLLGSWATKKFILFSSIPTRLAKCRETFLGPHFTGTLVTDCYKWVMRLTSTDKKQKMLAHWLDGFVIGRSLTKEGTLDFAFFSTVREFVRRACAFHRERLPAGHAQARANYEIEESGFENV